MSDSGAQKENQVSDNGSMTEKETDATGAGQTTAAGSAEISAEAEAKNKAQDAEEAVMAAGAAEKTEHPGKAGEETAKEQDKKPSEEPAEGSAKEPAPDLAGEKKSSQPRSTKPQRPDECAGCGKSLTKKSWFYRNGSFYCTKKCFKRKAEEDKKKADEEKNKE